MLCEIYNIIQRMSMYNQHMSYMMRTFPQQGPCRLVKFMQLVEFLKLLVQEFIQRSVVDGVGSV